MPGSKCERCDREECRRAAAAATLAAGYDAATWASSKAADVECEAHAVDWRARCLAAESALEVARLAALDVLACVSVNDSGEGLRGVWCRHGFDSVGAFVRLRETLTGTAIDRPEAGE